MSAMKTFKNLNEINLKELSEAKEAAQKELNQWLATLSEIAFDKDKLISIEEESDNKTTFLNGQLWDVEQLLMKKEKSKNLEIQLFYNTKIDSLIDFLSAYEFNSAIIETDMVREFLSLCEFASSTKFSLLYQASRDGFGAIDFHSKCDNKARTITIIKTTLGYIFGGYTEAAWSSDQPTKDVPDPNAFLFSLVNKDKQPIKIDISNDSNNEIAICCNLQHGPQFGYSDGYKNIFISNKPNVGMASYAELGYPFEHPTYEDGSDKAKKFLAGSVNFQVAEIEIFQVA